MEAFLSIITTKEMLLSLFALFFGIIYSVTAGRVLIQLKHRRLEKQKEVRAVISKGLRSGTLQSNEDFIDAYRGILKLGADDISHRSGLARALREFIVGLVQDDTVEREEAQRLKAQASDLLRRLESESPFAELPAAERNLFIDIESFLQAGQQSPASAKLKDLAGLVEARQDAMNRLQSSNRWSVPLAAIGLVLTVVFGVVSLVK